MVDDTDQSVVVAVVADSVAVVVAVVVAGLPWQQTAAAAVEPSFAAGAAGSSATHCKY